MINRNRTNSKSATIRIVSLMLVVCTLLSSCTPQEATIKHTDLSFAEIEYVRPDVPAVEKTIAEATELAKNGDKKSLDLYENVIDDMRTIKTMYSVANIRHDSDLTETYYEGELTFLSDSYTRLDNLLNALTEELLGGKLANAATKAWGLPFVERFNEAKLTNSPEIEELGRRETDLVNKYNRLLRTEYTTTAADGTEIKIADLDFSLPIHDQYYDEIYYKRKYELGEIYVELCAIRAEMAEKLNFSSYTDLAYHGKDYTKEQSAAFSAEVKAELVPLYMELTKKYQRNIWRANAQTDATINDALEVMKAAFATPQYPKGMAEALEYMLSHGAYNFDSGDNMAQGAYSTLIEGFGMPYMYIEQSREYDPTTLIHEFGHYYNFYNFTETRWNDSHSRDLSEINSQGLELLMHDKYGEIFGEKNAEIFRIANVLYTLQSVIAGCAEDEFQQRVMQNPGMTVDEINKLYVEISKDYYANDRDFVWVEINHHFESPFYYISYATSAISALELWEISLESPQKAFETYSNLCGNTKNQSYLAVLEEQGLHSPFEAGSAKRLAETLRRELLPPGEDSAGESSSDTDVLFIPPTNDE